MQGERGHAILTYPRLLPQGGDISKSVSENRENKTGTPHPSAHVWAALKRVSSPRISGTGETAWVSLGQYPSWKQPRGQKSSSIQGQSAFPGAGRCGLLLAGLWEPKWQNRGGTLGVPEEAVGKEPQNQCPRHPRFPLRSREPGSSPHLCLRPLLLLGTLG